MRISIVLFLGFVIVALINPNYFLQIILIFLFVELIFISQKFTQRIVIDSNGVEIIYFQSFFKKTLFVPKNEIGYKVLKTAEYRGGKYFILKVLKNSKVVYSVDSRDGFDKQDFETLIKSYS